MDYDDDVIKLFEELEIDDETANYDILEKKCFGKIVVSAVNWRLGGGDCNGCERRNECIQAIKMKYTDFIDDLNCLGRTDCSPHVTPKGCSIRCKLTEQCYKARSAVWYSREQPESMKSVIRLTYLEDSKMLTEDAKIHAELSSLCEDVDTTLPEPVIKPVVMESVVIEPVIETKSPVSVVKSPHLYSFPMDEAFQVELRACQLLSTYELKLAMADIELKSASHSYGDLRRKYSAIGIALNGRQELHPVLRPRIFLIKDCKVKISKNSPESVATNDAQVIDLNWLYHSGVVGTSERWAKMFDPVFDFEAASRFVETVGSAANKAGELRLSRAEMLVLSVIADGPARARKSDIRTILREKGGVIKTQLREPRCRQKCSAGEMIHTLHSLLLADLDIAGAVVIMKQSFGVSVDELTMRRRKDWLKKGKMLHDISHDAGLLKVA